MSVANGQPIVGFDRKFELPWLEAVACWVREGVPLSDLRSRLARLLEGEVAGVGPHSARGKTITVLVRICCLVPEDLVSLRDEGLSLLEDRRGRRQLLLHWGMCLATCPFFRSVAVTTGRLLGLQGTVTLSQITRRVVEAWSERSTVTRATQRLVRSLVSWGVLLEAGERGVFVATPRIEISNADPVGPWLVKAGITNGGQQARSTASHPITTELFPFMMSYSGPALVGRTGLGFHPQWRDHETARVSQHAVETGPKSAEPMPALDETSASKDGPRRAPHRAAGQFQSRHRLRRWIGPLPRSWILLPSANPESSEPG